MQTFRGPKHHEPARLPCPQSSGTCRQGLAGSHGPRASENSPWYRSHFLAQRPKLATETLIPQEWLNLARSEATAAAVQTLRADAGEWVAPSALLLIETRKKIRNPSAMRRNETLLVMNLAGNSSSSMSWAGS